MDNYRYPIGSDTKDAPWNQKDLPVKEIEATISITLSKPVKVKVNDYSIFESGKDEYGNYYEDLDFSNCDIKRAVEEQVILPNRLVEHIIPLNSHDKKVILDGSNWVVDDFEVILEKDEVLSY